MRFKMLLGRVVFIADSPGPRVMAVPDPNGTRLNDKIIFCTGQSWRIRASKLEKRAMKSGLHLKMDRSVPFVRPSFGSFGVRARKLKPLKYSPVLNLKLEWRFHRSNRLSLLRKYLANDIRRLLSQE